MPIHLVTMAASALVLGKAVAKRLLAGIVNESTNPDAQPTPPDLPGSIRKLVDSEQEDVASAFVEHVLAPAMARKGAR